MKPKILIDASTVTPIEDGLSNYIIGIISHLPSAAFDEFDFFVLATPNVDRPEFIDLFNRLPLKPIWEKIAPVGPKRDLTFARFLFKYRGQFDLIHNTTTSFPLALRGGVATVHDVTFKYMFDPKRNPFGLAVRYLDMVVRNAISRSEAMIAVSHSTKSEIAKFFAPTPQQLDRIRVIYEGWEHLNLTSEESRCSDLRPTQGNYLFSLGTGRPHKNIPALLEAFAQALPYLPENVQLILSGSVDKIAPKLDRLISRINSKGDRVIFTGYLSRACVFAYIQGADGFILPSLHEGFGISVLEAFHCKTPLLCGNQSSPPEIAANAALTFDPNQVSSIAAALVAFYARRKEWPEFVSRGSARLSHFSWTKAAAETLELYREVLASRKFKYQLI